MHVALQSVVQVAFPGERESVDRIYRSSRWSPEGLDVGR